MTTKKRLYRVKDEQMIGGVCAGLGEYFEMDPTIFRIGFIALALAGGPGFILYLILLLVMPEKYSVI